MDKCWIPCLLSPFRPEGHLVRIYCGWCNFAFSTENGLELIFDDKSLTQLQSFCAQHRLRQPVFAISAWIFASAESMHPGIWVRPWRLWTPLWNSVSQDAPLGCECVSLNHLCRIRSTHTAGKAWPTVTNMSGSFHNKSCLGEKLLSVTCRLFTTYCSPSETVYCYYSIRRLRTRPIFCHVSHLGCIPETISISVCITMKIADRIGSFRMCKVAWKRMQRG